MAETMPNLWPADFGEITILTPVAILRQQGVALGQRTQNIVVGRVLTQAAADGFHHLFLLHCGPLGYSTELLAVDHGIDLYPARVSTSTVPNSPLEATSPEDLEDKLKQVFASDKTKKIIGSLLAQSKQ